MILLGIISAGFIVLAIILILVRLILDLRFSAIQKEPDQSPLFRRKVHYLRKIEQAKDIRYLLVTCLTIGIALMIFIGSFVFLAEDYQKMKTQSTHLEDRMERMDQQQKRLVASIPLKNYPKEGIGLKDYSWEKLTAENKDSKLQKKMEAAISDMTVPYFGSTAPTVSLAVPKTISLELKGRMDDTASKETIKKNIDDFAKEAEVIAELTDIHVRMISSMGKDKKIIYSVNYSRDNNEERFTKKNVSEQNLKNDGGKG
ncbi:hypothetical protein [Enterococcus sp. AZ196]|uniref:hypothetical protein n=1 Tax=Enterococcus sp. AZ196 TaxID=2774659 RepID=UPI003D2C1A84